MSGTYVLVDLAVDARGALTSLELAGTDLPAATARCVRDVLAAVRFPAGAPAAWRERVEP